MSDDTLTTAAMGELRHDLRTPITAMRINLEFIEDAELRERLLKNLLASSPLFKPFDNQQQMELIRRFEGIDIAAGTTVIRENEIGQGLFVILVGEVEVIQRGKTVARLRSGDLFGEMALLGDSPTNAEVRTVIPTSILFLGRDYFRRLVSALPALRKYFENLSRSRAKANA